MLGSISASASVWDFDDDRTSDDLQMRGDLAMYVVDNDNHAPTSVGTVRVNGVAVPGTPPTATTQRGRTSRSSSSASTVAVDQDPGASYTAKQRILTGIGEYRVTTVDVSAMTPSNRAMVGTPYPVATTNGALANYGFEMPTRQLDAGWEQQLPKWPPAGPAGEGRDQQPQADEQRRGLPGHRVPELTGARSVVGVTAGTGRTASMARRSGSRASPRTS
jgi:hypothetical protein